MFFNVDAKILKKTIYNESHCGFKLQNEQIAENSLPGHFGHFMVNESIDLILRRPISICDSDRKSTFEIFFKIVGAGTSLLAKKNEGECLNVIAPLGNPFTLSMSKKSILIGGGIGIAPLFYLARELRNYSSEVIVFYGGKTADDLPFCERLRSVCDALYLTTEDGSLGDRGLITDAVKRHLQNQEKDSRIYLCGPKAMAKSIYESGVFEAGLVQSSLENSMACGVGACQGCVVRLKSGEYKRVCKDGPVFILEDIQF